MRILVSTFAVLGFATFSATAVAADFRADESLFFSVPISDDLYAAGESVSVKQSVAGDLLVAGAELSVSGSIEQDLIATGGDVTISGSIGDDARVAGGSVSFSSVVGDDLIIMGGDVRVTDQSVINGDVRVFGGNVTIDGLIKGNLYVRSGRLVMNGAVSGSTDIQTGELQFRGSSNGNAEISAMDFVIDDGATFGGDLAYWQPDGPYFFGSAAVAGSTRYDEALAMNTASDLEHEAPKILSMVLIGIFGYTLMASALIILLLVLITKSYFVDAAKRMTEYPGTSLWYGFLYVVATPTLAFFACLTLIGVPVGILIIFLYGFTMLFAKALSAPVIAKWLQLHYKKNWNTFTFFLVSIGVYVVLCGLTLIPLFGWVALWVLVLMSLGALAHTEYAKFRKVR